MLTDDAVLSSVAADVLTEVTALYKVDTRAELDIRRAETRDAIQQLVMGAKRHL